LSGLLSLLAVVGTLSVVSKDLKIYQDIYVWAGATHK